MAPNTLHVLLLWGICYDSIKLLKLICGGDASHRSPNVIVELFQIYSRGTSKIGKGPSDILTRVGKSIGNGITISNIGNMLKDFKIYILNSLSSQLDMLHMYKKRREVELTLIIFCTTCIRKHPLKEHLLDHNNNYAIVYSNVKQSTIK